MLNKSTAKFQKKTSKPIKICSGSWIGAYSIILQGVTIGEHSVVAANSVVANDVEPYTVVGGVPSRFIKKIQG